jgi:hypothetical protein
MTERLLSEPCLDGREGCVEGCDMDQRDWEFLDKQTRWQRPAPPPTSTVILMLLAIFVAGITTGALLFSTGSQPVPTGKDGKAALAFLLNGPRG